MRIADTEAFFIVLFSGGGAFKVSFIQYISWYLVNFFDLDLGFVFFEKVI